jgi:hypothetical protein
LLETVEQRNRLAQVLSEFEDVFARHPDDIGRTKLVKHDIDTGDAKPVNQRCRRFAKAHVKVIRDQIRKLSEAGIIRPSNSNWAANPVVVDKKPDANGQIEKRMCIDYRGLNAATINPDSYLLPRIDDTLDALYKAKYFCTLDLTQGYHQVELAEESKHKTAFHAPYCNPSQWEYNYMPFGLVRAPRTFQRMMDRVIQGLEYETALAYLDDVIVFGRDLDQTMDRMIVILERLRSANLKLKAKKCVLFARSVQYLGHVISDKGVTTDPKKIQDVVNWHRPRTVKQVRGFLGIVNYYSRFVKNLAGTADPLYQITKKNAKFNWQEKHEVAFQELKKKLAEAPVMAYPNEEGRFILDTDASDYAYGAVLSQLQPNDKGEQVERVIAYHSKRFSDRESRYCARRRELLGIKKSVEHFEVYLRGVNFTVRTDHASLRYIKTTKNLPDQVIRWVMYLEEFNYKIEIRKGTLHTNADAMSRGCHSDKQCICEALTRYELKHDVKPGDVLDGEVSDVPPFWCNQMMAAHLEEECRDGKCFVNAFRLNPKYTTEELAKMQEKDPDIRPVLLAFRQNSEEKPDWPKISPCSSAAKFYFSDWERLRLHGGALYRIWESKDGTRLVNQFIVPRELKVEFCEKVHNTSVAAHTGRRKTLHALTHFGYWYKMADDIAFWIKTCHKCQMRKAPNPKPRKEMEILLSGSPNYRLQMDICGPLKKTQKGNQYVLVITDTFSKFTKAFAMPNQTAETVANNLLSGWIREYGPPMELHTDQGANFESALIRNICELYRINKTRTSAYHPQADGQVERFNRSLMTMIYGSMEKDEEWDETLEDVISTYNGTVHEVTTFTPNLMWFGRERRFTLGMFVPDPDVDKKYQPAEYVKLLKKRLENAYDLARVMLNKRALQNKENYDRKKRKFEYVAGQKILLQDHTRHEKGTAKFAPKYSGPFYVIDRIGGSNYRVQETYLEDPQVVHHDRMKPYEIQEPYIIPEWVGNASKALNKLTDGMFPTVNPAGKVPELFKKTVLRNSDHVEINLVPEGRRRIRKRRKIRNQEVPGKEKQSGSGNTNQETQEKSDKPKPKRGRPKKRTRSQEKAKPIINEEADAAQPTRTRSGRMVKRPKRD